MATIVPFSSSLPNFNSRLHSIYQPIPRHKLYRFRCAGENPTTNSDVETESVPENALLKVAWNASELLGIAASFFRSPEDRNSAEQEASVLARDGSGPVDRAVIVQAIKQDFDRSYFVTGNLTLDAYEEECEFADPASSFKGLLRFKRNCTNFGSLLEKSDMKLMKWEDFEDKGIGHWRFSCILSFPWRPILSASGYTEYFLDAESGKVCRHVEHWNVPKMALLKQILRPSRKFWSKRRG
ncbi:uncharacterized protein LOC21404341 [Morus notabilis]|uniref:uncharacterized protein LOC21404341 n=1 Tax=Morus notabilis TaxID=981085 RepID=UPI000CED0984|nr:uncharacterized protein LOC21404341 [Morus notabilis]